MTVRPLETADEAAVWSLQTFLEHANPDLIDATLSGPFIGRVSVDQQDGVVGYAVALPGQAATLSELVVAPGHRRCNHGRRLVDAIVSATGADRLVVMTPTMNDSARRFYEAVGFEVEQEIESFYADGTDALRLARGE